MIYDTFLFYNELDLLEIRLNELKDVVDKFVLVEGTVSHTNKPKKLFYNENKKRFKKFKDKIIHVVVEDSPNVGMTWIIERHQLTAVERGLKNCKPEDVILYSCVDEIPRPDKILEWKDKPGRLKAFSQTLCFYYLNFYTESIKHSEHTTRMFKYKDLKKIFKDIYLTSYLPPDVEISDGGWHFSYMGGIKKIQQKLSSFAHQELNNDKYNTPEKIRKAILLGNDPFGFGWKFKIGGIDMLPLYVARNQNKFKDLILVEDSRGKTFFKIELFLLDINHFLRIKLFRKINKFRNSF